MRVGVVFCLLLVAALAVGCFAPSNYQAVPPPTATPPDRQDCGQILGTAFRSEAEAAWFDANCSAWVGATLGRVDQPAAPTAAQAPGGGSPTADNNAASSNASTAPTDPNAQRCAQLRGRPYPTPADRSWFLANCVDTQAAGAQPDGSTGPGTEACDQISDPTGLSAAEQAWFRANCH